jgi:hypothetical protein
MAHSMWVGQLTSIGAYKLTTLGEEGDTPVADDPCGWPILRSTQHGMRLNGERQLCAVCHGR